MRATAIPTALASLFVIACASPNAPAPELARDLRPGTEPTGAPASSFPSFLTAFGDRVAFVAFVEGTIESGGNLYVSDGTPTGTVLVRAFSDYPHDLATDGDRLFFTAGDADGWGIWTSDATSAGTRRLLVIDTVVPGELNRATTARVGGLYFVSVYSSGIGRDGGLWVTDGTPEGTRRIGAGPGHPRGLVAVGDHVLIFDGLDLGGETTLSVSDGTPEGTHVVTTIPESAPNLWALHGTSLLFASSLDGTALWITDGTAEGTRVLERFPARNFRWLGACGEQICFSTVGPDGRDPELRITDGSSVDGSILLATAEGRAAASWGRGLVLLASDGLRTSDGTVAGTASFFALQDAGSMLATERALLFFGDDGTGPRIWQSDGTALGTLPLGGSVGGGDPVRAGDRVFFAGGDGTTGAELWSVRVSALGS